MCGMLTPRQGRASVRVGCEESVIIIVTDLVSPGRLEDAKAIKVISSFRCRKLRISFEEL